MISRRVSIFAILLMVGGCSLTSDKQYEVTTVTTQDAQQAAVMISAYRESKGLSPLSVDERLNRAAIEQARRVAGRGDLDHGDFTSRVADAGIEIRAGENLEGGAKTASEAIEHWKVSPGHNKNMLMPEARRMGFARADSPSSSMKRYWTLVLGQ